MKGKDRKAITLVIYYCITTLCVIPWPPAVAWSFYRCNQQKQTEFFSEWTSTMISRKSWWHHTVWCMMSDGSTVMNGTWFRLIASQVELTSSLWDIPQLPKNMTAINGVGRHDILTNGRQSWRVWKRNRDEKSDGNAIHGDHFGVMYSTGYETCSSNMRRHARAGRKGVKWVI